VIQSDLLRSWANLLNNAAKYTQKGGVISLTVEREDSRAKLTVQDNGPGIPAEMQTKIFDLFTQLDRTYDRAQGGVGNRTDIGTQPGRNARRHGRSP